LAERFIKEKEFFNVNRSPSEKFCLVLEVIKMKKLRLNFSYSSFAVDTRQKVEPLASPFVNKQQKSGEFSYSPLFAVDKNSGEFS
jgi:hypothetical protein